MLSFLRNKNKENLKSKGKESSVSSQDLLNEQDDSTVESVETELSLPSSWDVPVEQQYVYRFLNNELEPLRPNQISLAGIELTQDAGQLVVIAFVRNSLAKGITLGLTKLLLLDEQGEVIARKEFDLSVIGEIPAKSSRPWNFIFEANTVEKSEVPKEGFKLAFELKTPHKLDLEPSWETSLSDTDKEKLSNMIDNMEAPKENEVNILGLQAAFHELNGLSCTVLFRNGSTNNVKLEELPLKVEDATGEVIATGSFKLDSFEVKANTTKPWTFIFPKELVTKENPDLSRWKVLV